MKRYQPSHSQDFSRETTEKKQTNICCILRDCEKRRTGVLYSQGEEAGQGEGATKGMCEVDRKRVSEQGGGLPGKAQLPSPDDMRDLIIDVATKLEDEKLLRMLYIRAKTLQNL